jgi:hypothetical protein
MESNEARAAATTETGHAPGEEPGMIGSSDPRAAASAEAARTVRRDRARAWERKQKAAGRCRCGALMAPESKSRCFGCLEYNRRAVAARRGRPVKGRRWRGRPLLGSLGERRAGLAEIEASQAWRREQRWKREMERLRRYY